VLLLNIYIRSGPPLYENFKENLRIDLKNLDYNPKVYLIFNLFIVFFYIFTRLEEGKRFFVQKLNWYTCYIGNL